MLEFQTDRTATFKMVNEISLLMNCSVFLLQKGGKCTCLHMY